MTTASARELAEAAHACQAERDAHAALRDRWDRQQAAENDLRARCTELTFELRAAEEDLALSQMTQASQLSQVLRYCKPLRHLAACAESMCKQLYFCVWWQIASAACGMYRR